MSKKTFAFVIIIILAIIGGLLWFFLFRTTGTSVPGTNGSNPDLFPFGQGGVQTGTEPGNNNGGTSTSTVIDLGGTTPQIIPRLRQISTTPSAGAVAFDVGSTTMIRYVERATGHVSETESLSNSVVKLSNVTIPKVYEALWSNDGNRVLLRYLKEDNQTIRTFSAAIATGTLPEQAISGTFFPDGINDISVLGNKAFYLIETSAGAQGTIVAMNGTKPSSIFNSAFGDWTALWSSPNVITLFAKPSSTVKGAVYLMNATTGEYTKVAGDSNGLEGLSNADGSYVLLSGVSGGSFNASVFDVKKGSTVPLGVATLARKCIWSVQRKTTIFCAVPQAATNAAYPDDWYKGKVSFNDSVWKINVVTGETEEVFNPGLDEGEFMDIVNLSLDQHETTLVFLNKKDQTVWRYTLVE